MKMPNHLLPRAKATATLRQGLNDFVVEVLQAHLERQTPEASPRGWRSVFGQARREEVETVDARIAEEFERIEADDSHR